MLIRIVVFKDGRIIVDAPPEQLLSGSLLREIGIREPLYLTALRYAGVEITEQMKPQHVDSVVIGQRGVDQNYAFGSEGGAQGHGSKAEDPASRLKSWDISLPRLNRSCLIEYCLRSMA